MKEIRVKMQYIKVENSGYVNQVQANPRIIYDNHGQAYQVHTDPRNHGYITQAQTDPNSYHGYVNQVQGNHGYINQVQENHGYINQDETDPLHGFITQVQTGPNSYHGYINQVEENPGDFNQVQTENRDNVSHDQTGSNHGYDNQVQTGPTGAAEPDMLEHHQILKAVEANPDLHTFRRPEKRIKLENQVYNNQIQTGPTGSNRGFINQVQTGPTRAEPILQAEKSKPVPSKDLHTFHRPEPKVKLENQGFNNQVQNRRKGK